MDKFMKATYETCLLAGLDIVSVDTAARVMAILYTYGNNESFVYSPKFNCEREFIQKRYGLEGGETPDKDFVIAYREYVRELEDYAQKNPEHAVKDWAQKLVKERYGIEKLWL